jgi:hypothetical protein
MVDFYLLNKHMFSCFQRALKRNEQSWTIESLLAFFNQRSDMELVVEVITRQYKYTFHFLQVMQTADMNKSCGLDSVDSTALFDYIRDAINNLI